MSDVLHNLLENQGRGLRPLPVHISMAWMDQGDALNDLENQRFIEGIQAYLGHPYKRNVAPLETVWQQGQMRVLKSAAQNFVDTDTAVTDIHSAPVSIFIVPSLINRAHILDITEDRSFVRWLSQQGYDVFLCDWGDPTEDDAMSTLEMIIAERLMPAIDFVKGHSEKMYGMGYCMGGTLLCAAVHQAQDRFDGVVYLASPWDFHAGDRILQKQISTAAPAALDMIAARGYLPMEWIQSVFAVVNGTRAKDKFIRFANLDQESADAHLFVAVEEWLNDGVSLPGAVAQSCIQGWYINNLTGEEAWCVAGQAVKLADILTPSLVVASKNDRLVPQASSFAMHEALPHSDLLSLNSGHIGMITGRRAEIDMWQPVHSWIAAQAS